MPMSVINVYQMKLLNNKMNKNKHDIREMNKKGKSYHNSGQKWL